MIPNLALLSDNFYKFLTSLSLLVVIYCASFSEFFIRPYNEQVFSMKKEINSIASRRWMLEGVKKDLMAQIGDTTALQYYYYYTNLDTSNKRDSAEQSNKYYYLNGLDSARRKLVDSLNKIYYQILIAKNDLATYYNHAYHEKKNINIREFTIWALGIIAFITFILAMISWSRLQKKADDRPDNKGPTYNIEVADNKELISKINALVSQVQALSSTIQNENKTK